MHRKVVAVLFCDMVGLTSLGESTEADALAREAVAITQRTDALNMQGDSFSELAQVLHAAGRRNEAAVTLGQALKRYARKNLAQAGQVRKRLAEFQDAASR
jgi:thioredoxin-like negative regulator of GroEL